MAPRAANVDRPLTGTGRTGPRRGPGPFTRSGAPVPCGGGGPGCADRPGWPSGVGSRDAGRGDGCSAGRCASSVCDLLGPGDPTAGTGRPTVAPPGRPPAAGRAPPPPRTGGPGPGVTSASTCADAPRHPPTLPGAGPSVIRSYGLGPSRPPHGSPVRISGSRSRRPQVWTGLWTAARRRATPWPAPTRGDPRGSAPAGSDAAHRTDRTAPAGDGTRSSDVTQRSSHVPATTPGRGPHSTSTTSTSGAPGRTHGQRPDRREPTGATR